MCFQEGVVLAVAVGAWQQVDPGQFRVNTCTTAYNGCMVMLQLKRFHRGVCKHTKRVDLQSVEAC